jgi:hypothetical protein
MPFYQCLVPAGSLSADNRSALAEAIAEAPGEEEWLERNAEVLGELLASQ